MPEFEFFRADEWIFVYRDGKNVYAGKGSNFDEINVLDLLGIDYSYAYIEGEDVERYDETFSDWHSPPKTSAEMHAWLNLGWIGRLE